MRNNTKMIYRPARLDTQTAALLETIATRESAGNQSESLRRIIREAAHARGLLLTQTARPEGPRAQAA